jgi:hypothetical protein
MVTINLTDIERDGLEEVFSILNMDFEEKTTIFSQMVTYSKNFINNLL